MNALLRLWDDLWFSAGSARNLAAARIIIAGHALWVWLSRDLASISGIPGEFWLNVPGTARWRYLLFPGHAAAEHWLQTVATLALVMALVGIASRVACFAAGILLYHFAPLQTIVWTPSPYTRGLTLSVLALLTLAFSPCGDALSVLRWGRSIRIPERNWQYGWPLRLIQLFVCQMYLFAAYSKLASHGTAWLYSLPSSLLFLNQRDPSVYYSHDLGLRLANHPIICFWFAVGTLALEFAFPLVLFSRICRLVFFPLMIAFHIGVLLTMGILFLNLPQLLVFVDWDLLAARWLTRPAERSHAGHHLPPDAAKSASVGDWQAL